MSSFTARQFKMINIKVYKAIFYKIFKKEIKKYKNVLNKH